MLWNLILLPQSHKVLYLHRVGSAQHDFYPKGILTEVLEEILNSIIHKGFRFISLREALHRCRSGKSNAGTVSLTSDDGFASNHRDLLPLVSRLSIPVTMFMIGKCLDNRALAWNHKLLVVRRIASERELLKYLNSQSCFHLIPGGSSSQRIFRVQDTDKDLLADLLWDRFVPVGQKEYLNQHKPFLSREEMLELQATGTEFALHSYSHADFSRLSLAAMQDELIKNRNALQELGFTDNKLFAFPYGRYCSEELLPQLCKNAGIDLCLGTRYSIRDNRFPNFLWQRQPLELPRNKIPAELWLKPYLRVIKDSL